MKVALVQPVRIEEPIPSLGLSYLHQSLLNDGHQVRQLDVNFDYHIKRKIEKFYPDYIGVTVCNPQVWRAKWIVDYAKSLNIPVIIGGPSVTQRPEYCLRELGADIAVMGDGVFAIQDAINANYSARGIARIVDGTFLSTGTREAKINEWPTPVVRKNENRIARLTSAVGCYADCTFCNVRELNPQIGLRNAEKILEDMTTIARLDKPREFFFQDDNSFMNLKQLEEVLCGMNRLRLRQKISYSTRANQVCRSEDIFRRNDGRIKEVNIGIESFLPQQLERWSKGTTREDNLSAIDILLRNNIRPRCYMIAFDEQSTYDEAKQSFDFFAENPFYFFYTYPFQMMCYDDDADRGFARYKSKNPGLPFHYARDIIKVLIDVMTTTGLQPYRNQILGSPGLQTYPYPPEILEKSRFFFYALHTHMTKLGSGLLTTSDSQKSPLSYDLGNMTNLIVQMRQSMFIAANATPPDPEIEGDQAWKIIRDSMSKLIEDSVRASKNIAV